MKKYHIYRLTLLFAAFITLQVFAQEADSVRLKAIVTELADDSYLGRGFGTPQGRAAAAYIVSEFKKSGVEPFFDDWYHSFNYRSNTLNIDGNNIVGIVKGSDPDLADEYIIVGGHYDHVGWKMENGDTVVYNGADDNASGVAGVIELGRLLSENKDKLGRSVILMAFDGEETGLIGSKAFVRDFIQGDDPLIKPEQVAVMFSLDMLGMYDTHGGIDILGIDMLTDHKSILDKALAAAPVIITKSNGSLQNRTDTAPFGKIGIPSIHVWTGTESPYHKPEDDSNLLEYQGMSKIVSFMYALVNELSTMKEIEKAKDLEASKEGKLKVINPGITLDIGGSHFNYKDHWAEAHGVFSYAAGFTFETRIAKILALQPEVLYEWGGSQIETGKINMHAITVPVSLLLLTPDPGGMGVRAYYQAGGYYRYIFDSNDPDFTTNYEDTDYGFVFGVGMQIMHVRMGYELRQSLMDITTPANPDGGLDARMTGSFFKIGWVF